MIRFWLALLLGLAGITAAYAIRISPAEQIIIMAGKTSSASGGGATPCGTGVIDLSTGCSLPIALGLVP